MGRKKILYLLVIFALLLPINTKAALEDVGGSGGSGNYGSGCSGKDSCWPVDGNGKGLRGARVSIVDISSGNTISTRDYAPSQVAANWANALSVTRTSAKARSGYLSSGISSSSFSSGGRASMKYIGSFPFWDGDVAGFNAAWLSAGEPTQLLQSALQDLGYPCISGGKFEVSGSCSLDYMKKYYILIEPVTILTIHGINYYGSGAEMGYLKEYFNPSWAVKVINNMATSYLTGEMKYTDLDGKQVDMYRLNGVTGYFSGKTLSKSDYVSSTGYNCEANYSLNAKCLYYGKSSSGMHLIYPYQQYVIKGKCDLNKEELFKNGGTCCKTVANSPKDYGFASKDEFYNAKLGSTGKTYKELCEGTTTTTPTPSSCNYNMTISASNQCTTGKGTFKDIGTNDKEWACIFDSDKNSQVKNYYYKSQAVGSSNPYCRVYCREEVEYDFSSKFDVVAGGYVTVNDASGFTIIQPVKIKGTSTCKTGYKNSSGKYVAGIDVDKFYKEYKEYNQDVYDTWDDYQIELKRAKSNSTAIRSSSKNCDKRCDSYANEGGEECCLNGYYKPDYCINEITGERYECGSTWVCTSYQKKYYHGYTYSPTNQYYDGRNYKTSKWCSSSEEADTTYEDSTYRAYQNALNTRDEAIKNIYRCNDYSRDFAEFAPNITLEMSKLLIYDKTYQLEYNDQSSTMSYAYNASGSSIGSTSIGHAASNKSSQNSSYADNTTTLWGQSKVLEKFYECRTNGVKCTATSTHRYPTNKIVKQETIITRTFKLKSGLYGFVDKYGVSYSGSRQSDNDTEVGYSNIPIAYKTPDGTYPYILIYKDVFGTKQNVYVAIKNSTTGKKPGTKGDNSYITTTRTQGGIYNCSYKVTSEYQETGGPGGGGGNDPTDVTVIYRPISLSNPFPGKDATSSSGRTPGSNWNNAFLIRNFITNNRSVSADKVYNLKPIYEFTLTSANILAIRKYNNQQNKGEGYADFTLKCKDGVNCISDFIHNGRGKGYFGYTSTNGGLCIKSSTVDFDSCRYKK